MNGEKNGQQRALLLALSLLIVGFVYGCGAQSAPPMHIQPEPAASGTPVAGSPAPGLPPPTEDEAKALAARLASPGEPLVAVYLGDALYAVRPLGKEDTICIDQGDGKRNEISITGSSVYMSHASCENQDCVQQSAVTLDNLDTRVLFGFIICLPNSVTVELVPGPKA